MACCCRDCNYLCANINSATATETFPLDHHNKDTDIRRLVSAVSMVGAARDGVIVVIVVGGGSGGGAKAKSKGLHRQHRASLYCSHRGRSSRAWKLIEI